MYDLYDLVFVIVCVFTMDQENPRRNNNDVAEMLSFYLIIAFIASFIYFWIWFYSLTSVHLILDSNSISNHTSHNKTFETSLIPTQMTTSTLPEISYSVQINKHQKKLNFGVLGVLAFWTLVLTVILISILNNNQDPASFLLQQMLFINLILFSASSTMLFLCNFSDIYPDAYTWCQKLKIYGNLSFSIAIGSALSLAFYYIFKIYVRNRDHLEVTEFARIICFLTVCLICSMSYIFTVGIILDIVIFSIAILIVLISINVFCCDCRTLVTGLFTSLLLSMKTLVLQLDSLLRIPCDCFHKLDIDYDYNCDYDSQGDFMTGTNDLISRYSAFATIFSLFYPSLNVVLVIIFLPGARERFSEIFILPKFFRRENKDRGGLHEPLLNGGARANIDNVERNDRPASNVSSAAGDIEEGYYTPDEDSDISRNMYNDPHGERYMQIEPGNNHVYPECNAHGPEGRD